MSISTRSGLQRSRDRDRFLAGRCVGDVVAEVAKDQAVDAPRVLIVFGEHDKRAAPFTRAALLPVRRSCVVDMPCGFRTSRCS